MCHTHPDVLLLGDVTLSYDGKLGWLNRRVKQSLLVSRLRPVLSPIRSQPLAFSLRSILPLQVDSAFHPFEVDKLSSKL